MKKTIIVICISVLLALSSCTQNISDDVMSTESNQEILEIIIPDSLLNISGISELEYIALLDDEIIRRITQ